MTSRVEALLEEAERIASLSVADMAGKIPSIERVAIDLADVLDTTPWPYAPDEEGPMGRAGVLLACICAQLGRALGRPDPGVSLDGCAHAVPPMPDDVQIFDHRETFVSSMMGQIFRRTRSGRLVARVEELEASALRIMRLPVMAERPVPDKGDLKRQRELQIFNLRRIHDALVVALRDADVVRRSANPLKELFLVTALKNAEITLGIVACEITPGRPQGRA